MKSMFKNFMDRRAFTLMELMIVLVIIGILMSGIFMLMGIATKHGDIAKTRSKIQKLQNAVSGFYAAYGTYPPVDNAYGPLDPFTNFENDFNEDVNGSGTLNPKACRLACRAQPVAFEYPCPIRENNLVEVLFESEAVTPNFVYQNAATIQSYTWNPVRMFKFGLMSFLLPRIQVVGVPGQGGFTDYQPIPDFYDSRQWKVNNENSMQSSTGVSGAQVEVLRSQSAVENRIVSKWLPNLEGMCCRLGRSIMNINLTDDDTDMGDQDLDLVSRGITPPPGVDYHGIAFRGPYEYSGQQTVLRCATVKDSWDQDLYYYSAPPYQSYRIWSAGPDKKTFPPWIPLDAIDNSTDRDLAASWLEDDIVGID